MSKTSPVLKAIAYLCYIGLGLGVARGLDKPEGTWDHTFTVLMWPGYVAEPFVREYVKPRVTSSHP